MVGWIKNHIFMERTVRPSIFVVRGDGLPRCARSDGTFCAQRRDFPLAMTGIFARIDAISALPMTKILHS